MDTKKVELLLKAMDIGSLKKTAQICNYTQSGIIYTINALEKELGIQFIERNAKGVVPTEEGRVLKPYLEEIVAAAKRFDERVELLFNNPSSTLEIGVWPSMARNWFPDLLRNFNKKHPDVRVHLNIATKDLTSLLNDGSIDCAIAPSNIAGTNNYIHLRNDRLSVAVPQDFPFPDDEPVPFSKLSDHPIFLTAHFPIGTGSKNFQEWYFSLSASQKVYIKSSDGLTLLSMVENGYGIAFLSDIYRAECPKTVRMLSLEEELITETVLALSTVKPATKILNDFIREVQEYVSELKFS